MEYLKINKEDAINIYNNGSDEVKNTLVEMFGKDAFKSKFDDSIKTWKDVCTKLKISENQDVVRRLYQDIHCEQLHEKAFCKAQALYELIAIQTAINDGIDFDDNGRSYYPYWDFRFMGEKELPNCTVYKRVDFCDCHEDMYGKVVLFMGTYCRKKGQGTDYGFPISYNSSEAAEHAAKYFEDVFFEYYGIHIIK